MTKHQVSGLFMSKRSPMDGDIKCALSTTCAHFFLGGGQRVSRGAHTTQHSTRNIEHYTFLTAHLSKQQSRCELSSYPLSKMCQTASSEQPWLSPLFFLFFSFFYMWIKHGGETLSAPGTQCSIIQAYMQKKSKTKRIFSLPGAESAAGFVRRKIRMNG